MKFDDLVGIEIFIGLKGLIETEAELPPASFPVKLVGTEPSGIWVESDGLGAVFEAPLWKTEMREWGPDAVGKILSCSFFLPFSELRFVIALREKE